MRDTYSNTQVKKKVEKKGPLRPIPNTLLFFFFFFSLQSSSFQVKYYFPGEEKVNTRGKTLR